MGLGVFGEEAKEPKKGASWDNLDYKIIYIEDPKKVLKRERDPNQPINKASHRYSFVTTFSVTVKMTLIGLVEKKQGLD